MKNKWKIIAPILIVAALAAAFFLQGEDGTVGSSPQAVTASTEIEAAAENSAETANAEAEKGTAAEAATEAGEVAAETEEAAAVPDALAANGEQTKEQQSAAEISEGETEETSSTALEKTEGPAAENAETSGTAAEGNASAGGNGTESVTEENADGGNAAAEGSDGENAAAETAAGSAAAETTDVGNTGEKQPAENTVTISISCATINDNLENLDSAKTSLVPADGWILTERVVEFNPGESVFNVLQRVCKQNKIHMEFMNTPVYNSAYIEGIGNLYEFDCGPLSGWMYSVNDWYPNYGCSRYELKAGDVICWRYTCDLGSDIGGGYLEGVQKDD